MTTIAEIKRHPARTKWAAMILELAVQQDTRFTPEQKVEYILPAINKVCEVMGWAKDADGNTDLSFTDAELTAAFGYYSDEAQIWQGVEWLSDAVVPLARWLGERPWGYHYSCYTLPWKIREFGRFYHLKYKHLPWKDELIPIDGHFAHISTEADTKIAFTENADKGERDIQITMRPGRYLQRFYGDLLTSEEIRDYAVRVDNLHAICFARTADEIEDVYRRGPESCMSHGIDEYSCEVHPVRVYGDSDVSVAYLTENEGARGNKIIARCVCWEKKKIFGRIYGDKERLMHKLTGLGFESGEMDGARIRRIEIDARCVVMPYIDGDQTFSESEDKEWLIVGGCNAADRTDGLGYVVPVSRCGHCDTMRPRDEMVDVGDNEWCTDCAERHGDVCERTGDVVAEGDLIPVHDDEGEEYWCYTAVNRHATSLGREYFDTGSALFARLHTNQATEEDVRRFPWAQTRRAQEQAA